MACLKVISLDDLRIHSSVEIFQTKTWFVPQSVTCYLFYTRNQEKRKNNNHKNVRVLLDQDSFLYLTEDHQM